MSNPPFTIPVYTRPPPDQVSGQGIWEHQVGPRRGVQGLGAGFGELGTPGQQPLHSGG